VLLAAGLPQELSVLSVTTRSKALLNAHKGEAEQASPFSLPGRHFMFLQRFIPGARVTKIRPITSPARHTFPSSLAYSYHIMRGAFVVQLGPETKPAEGRFEGWVEEVDSSTELRFRSTEELLKFLGQRFDLAIASAEKARATNKSEQTPSRQKNPRKERSQS
jgi:hypothetical protein